jgi:hypothetical protein
MGQDKGALTKKRQTDQKTTIEPKLSTLVTGHGKLRGYLYRFKIIDDLACPCQMGPQSAEHLTRECTILNKQRYNLKNGIINAEGRSPSPTVSWKSSTQTYFKTL